MAKSVLKPWVSKDSVQSDCGLLGQPRSEGHRYMIDQRCNKNQK